MVVVRCRRRHRRSAIAVSLFSPAGCSLSLLLLSFDIGVVVVIVAVVLSLPSFVVVSSLSSSLKGHVMPPACAAAGSQMPPRYPPSTARRDQYHR